jgi:hypothetical protein
LGKHVRIAAELVGREDQHLDAPVRLFRDPISGLFGSDIERSARLRRG